MAIETQQPVGTTGYDTGVNNKNNTTTNVNHSTNKPVMSNAAGIVAGSNAHHAGRHGTHHAGILRSAVARAITAYLLTVWFIWFLVQIAINSISQSPSGPAYRSLLTQSFWNFGTQGLIMVGSLLAVWYSESIRTRSTQLVAAVVASFVVFTWFLDFDFVRYNLTSSDIHGYCDNTAGGNYYGNSSGFCRTSRAAAVLSVLMELGQVLLALYTLSRLALPLVEPTVSEEQILVTEASQLDTNRTVVHRVNSLNKSILTMVGISLAGYIIFTLSWIKLKSWEYGPGYFGPRGDPLFDLMGLQLSIIWIAAMASSVYASGRHSRGIVASAKFLTFLSMLSLWSFFIYSGRRVRQYGNGFAIGGGQFLAVEQVNFIDAERAVCVGLGIMLVFETLRFIALYLRYRTWIPVSISAENHHHGGQQSSVGGANGVVANNRNNASWPNNSTHGHGHAATALPTDNRPMAADFTLPVAKHAHPVLNALFVIHLLVTIAWFIVQLVLECKIGLFDEIDLAAQRSAQVYGLAAAFLYLDPERMFIYHLMIFGALFLAAYFSERIPLHCTAVAACCAIVGLISFWFLLMWPVFYNAIYSGGVAQDILLNADLDNNYSQAAKTVAVLGFLQLLALVLVFAWCAVRATVHRPLITTTRKGLNLFAIFVSMFALMWALSSIKDGLTAESYASAYNNGQLAFRASEQGYWNTVAFFVMTLTIAAVWINALVSGSDLANTSRGWKEAAWIITFTLATFIFPAWIYACRSLNWQNWNDGGDLNGGQKAILASIVLLGLSIIAMFCADTMLLATPRLAKGQALQHGHGTTQGEQWPANNVSGGMVNNNNNNNNAGLVNNNNNGVVANGAGLNTSHHMLDPKIGNTNDARGPPIGNSNNLAATQTNTTNVSTNSSPHNHETEHMATIV